MIFVIDIDSTLFNTNKSFGTPMKYMEVTPNTKIIDKVNMLYEQGHIIKIYTARGEVEGIDIKKETLNQLKKWGVKYHEIYFNKPKGDIYIDDRSITPEMFIKYDIWRDE